MRSPPASVSPENVCLRARRNRARHHLRRQGTERRLSKVARNHLYPVASTISANPPPPLVACNLHANPLACRVACASMGLLKTGAWQKRVANIEAQLREELAPCLDAEQVADVRCKDAIGEVETHEAVDVPPCLPILWTKESGSDPLGSWCT